jgi:hypothetical protein
VLVTVPSEIPIMVRANPIVLAAAFVAVGVMTLPPPVHATKSVYRCKVAGRVLYSDEPCGVQAREVAVDDARSPAQRTAAEAAAKREAALANKMRRERLEDERAARANARPSGIRSGSQAGVEYSNASGKVTKTVKEAPKRRTDIDESMPIYIDVPKAKDQPAPVRR